MFTQPKYLTHRKYTKNFDSIFFYDSFGVFLHTSDLVPYEPTQVPWFRYNLEKTEIGLIQSPLQLELLPLL
jgi:hypothetical protein